MEIIVTVLLTVHLAFAALPKANNGCFIQGECVEAYQVLFHLSETVLNCQELCLADDECNWFSWQMSTKVCLGFSNCPLIDEEKYPDSITGEVDCQNYQCWLSGSCEGTYINFYTDIEDYSSCRDKCENEMDASCEWFSYSAQEDLCITLQECNTLDSSCITCSSGEKSCFQDQATTTTTITTTNTSTTTTSTTTSTTIITTTTSTTTTATTTVPDLEPKLIVIGGIGSGTTLSDVEIISFNDLIQCPKPDDYPVASFGMVSGVVGNELIVCGGRGEFGQILSSCYKLDFSSGRGQWVQIASMTKHRYYAAVSVIAKGLFVTGGSDDSSALKEAEVYQDNEWNSIEDMPYAVRSHCSSPINETHFISIAGYPLSMNGNTAFIYDTTKDEWIRRKSVPDGNERDLHSCGKMSSSSNEIIVVGGCCSPLRNVLIYNVDADEWREGPEYPNDVYNSQMVLVNDAPTMVNGWSDQEGGYQNAILQLKDGQWVEMEQKLDIARRSHVANVMTVPNCVALE